MPKKLLLGLLSALLVYIAIDSYRQSLEPVEMVTVAHLNTDDRENLRLILEALAAKDIKSIRLHGGTLGAFVEVNERDANRAIAAVKGLHLATEGKRLLRLIDESGELADLLDK